MQLKCFFIATATAGVIMLSTQASAANVAPSDPEFDEILSLDIADLTVTSVSKREQKLNDTAAAIYVITQDDLRRAGVTSIPDALRMVPGLDVARVSASSWAISARGFNGTLSNKLQVLMDGRSIYTPVSSGVYWDDQSTMIEDIDRIEVIRGPGASIYGANAVDGVINIITKPAGATQGNFASATGSFNGGLLEARHGGQIDNNTFYRTYAQYSDAGTSESAAGNANHDGWDRARTGFRMDGKMANGDSYTFQGDAYGGKENGEVGLYIPTSATAQNTDNSTTSFGGNVLGHWNHEVDKDSTLNIQAYVDYYERLEELFDNQHVGTADIQAQNTVKLDDRNNFSWGGGVRLYQEIIEGTFTVSAEHSHQDHEVLNTFVQDEYALVPKTLYATLGSKFEYNDYTGFEFEPSGRLSWHMTDNQMVWGAISRAVRTPSTIDEDANIAFQVIPGAPATVYRIVGNTNQESEILTAYELGHRIEVTKNLSFDTTVYYNNFNDLETIGQAGASYAAPDGTMIVPYQINNLGSGQVYGGEIASNWNVDNKWRLTGSYSFSKTNLDVKPGSAITLVSTERVDPTNQFSLRSYYNVTDTVHWDNMIYYVSALQAPVGAYTRYDSRIAWLVTPGVEASLIGRNLLEPRHLEFSSTPEAEIDRSVVAQMRWRF